MSSIESLARRIESIGSAAALRQVAASMASEAVQLYRQGFDKKADPYGSLWAPRKEQVAKRNWRKTSGTLLVRTGYLRDSGQIESADETGFRLRVRAPYGMFHQFGTRYMPARSLVPNAASGLGNWGRPLYKVAAAAIRGLLK